MTTKNIYQRIQAVMEAAKYVQKTGYNSFHKYSYAKESDYLETVRPMLIQNGLVVTPTLKEHSQQGDITHVSMEFRVVNVDNPTDFFICTMPGSGQDKGDKGVYKAITGAKKYFVSTLFLIATGDDAEDDGSTEAAKPAAAPVAATKPAEAPAARPSFRRPGTPAKSGGDGF